MLKKSEIGSNTSLGLHLNYKYTLAAAYHLADHNYCKENVTIDHSIIKPEDRKIDRIQFHIKQTLKSVENVTSNKLHYNNMHNNNNQAQIDSNRKIVTMNLQGEISNLSNNINHCPVQQNSVEWMELRKGKVTGSRLAYLLGFHGSKKFDQYWKIVQENLQESELFNNNFINFKRGHYFENEALKHFCSESKSNAAPCGFFYHPTDINYGASPDALVSSEIILEIKTRAINSDGPLTTLRKNPSYFIQAQLEMACSTSLYCIVMSYHPETKSAKYFRIEKDSILLTVIKDITDSILLKKPITTWHHKENKCFKELELKVIHRIPDFQSLRSLRSYIQNLLGNIPEIKFV